MKNKTIINVILSNLIGIVIFLIILGLANIVAPYINNYFFNEVIKFLNENGAVIIIIGIAFLIGEAFKVITFPFNLPAPLFNGAAGVLLAAFVIKLLLFIDGITNQDVFQKITSLFPQIYLIVFLVILCVGYASIALEIYRLNKLKKVNKKHK